MPTGNKSALSEFSASQRHLLEIKKKTRESKQKIGAGIQLKKMRRLAILYITDSLNTITKLLSIPNFNRYTIMPVFQRLFRSQTENKSPFLEF